MSIELELKDHFETFLQDNGRYLIYRRYNVGTESEYYDPGTREGVGGEKWTFSDEAVIGFTAPVATRGDFGPYKGKTKIYLLASVTPKIHDVIAEPKNSKVNATQVLNQGHRLAHRIVDIDHKFVDNELIYNIAYTDPEYGDY